MMHVSMASIMCMGVSALVSIGAPIALFVIFYRKYKAPALPLLFGALAFIVCALILEGSVHRIVFANVNLRENPFMYTLYGTLMAGIFEETGRFISFSALKKLKKNYKGVGAGLSYGIGHGGIEAVALAGAAMINNIVLSVMISSGSAENILADLKGDTLLQASAQITALTTTESYLFLIGGVERLFAMGVQIALSILVFYAVYKKLWLYPLAILLHALVDIPVALMQVGVIKNIFFVEGLVGISCALLLLLAAYIHKNAMLTAVKE
jgi:uncharacterized membrane protein YhfC